MSRRTTVAFRTRDRVVELFSRQRDRFRLVRERRRIRRAGIWFVDIPRTGSTSLKTELARAFGPTFGKSDPTVTSQPALIDDHRTALEMIDFLGRPVWDALYTFTFVRNPWDRMVSLYRYRVKIHRSVPPSMDFNEYALLLKQGPAGSAAHSPFYSREFHWSCCAHILDRAARPLVKFVGRFESRAEHLREISSRLGIALDPELRLMATTESDYRAAYEREAIEVVGEHFKDDVETFGYSF